MASENSCTEVEDNDSIECFQNYTASEVFIQGLAGLIDQQDVESMIRAQKQMCVILSFAYKIIRYKMQLVSCSSNTANFLCKFAAI